MTGDALSRVRLGITPQTQRADARQTLNNAGGFTFEVGPLERLRRFLTLGVDGGTYYVEERELALRNAEVVVELCAAGQARAVVDEVVRVSVGGLAPRQQPGLFALALVASIAEDAEDRRYAFAQLGSVARTGYTRFKFIKYMRQFRGWGRAAKRAVAGLYLTPDVTNVAFQAVKYRQREGWTHRDVLRLAHPKPNSSDLTRRALFDWICGRGLLSTTADAIEAGRPALTDDHPLRIVEGYERIQRTNSVTDAVGIVRAYRLPWEALPDHLMNQASIWEVLLENGLPQTALIRQLPRLTRLGLLPNRGGWTDRVARQLASVERLQRGRVHPINVLVAQRTYARGYSVLGKSTWEPSRRVVDALDAAFYAAYSAVEPTGRRLLLALDVSGSMANHIIANMSLSPREASAALALVTLNVEDDVEVLGFSAGNRGRPVQTWSDLDHNTGVTPLTLSPRQRLDDATRSVAGLPFGRTDCALPMLYALEHNIAVDAFVIYTDSETYYGSVHPHEALRRYRQRTGIPAKLIVVGMTATSYSIADPADAGSLNVAGFDTSVPALISNFILEESTTAEPAPS